MKVVFLYARSLVFSAGIFSIFLTSCGSKPKSSRALVGIYDATTPFSKEVLTLDAAGAFRQQVTLSSSGKVTTTSGIWAYDAANGTIRFESNFILVMTGLQEISPDAEKPQKDAVVYDVLKSHGAVCIGDEEYVVYKHR